METKQKSEEENENHSGGVKTPEGKAISRYNAQKHAILRETISEYEKPDVVSFYNDLAEDLKPKGRLQEMLVETIASNAIRLQRISKAESEAIKESIASSKSEMKIFGNEYFPELSSVTVEKLDLYSRYLTATENRIYRALIVLRQLLTYDKN
jgi:hypothetical protein